MTGGRRRRASVALAWFAALMVGGCGGHGAPSIRSGSGAGNDAPNAADVQFVAAMVPHHRLGLDLITLAEPRADDVRLRRLVFEMTAYHHEELHALEERLDEWDVDAVDDFPGSLMPDVLADLTTAEGPDFDLAWLTAMIEHHEGAVEIAGEQMRTGTDVDLRAMAERVDAVQRAEITAMRELVVDLET